MYKNLITTLNGPVLKKIALKYMWEPQNLARTVPTLGPDGVDLLTKMLKYNPAERISAKAALNHPYFDSLDKSQF
ncbi:hypothetical protein HN51_069636 [Arachis hypogaea]